MQFFLGLVIFSVMGIVSLENVNETNMLLSKINKSRVDFYKERKIPTLKDINKAQVLFYRKL